MSPLSTPERTTKGEQSKDVRIDRFVSWFLMTVVTVGMGLAAYTYKGLSDKLEKFGDSVNHLSVSVALIQQREERVTEMKTEINTLKLEASGLHKEIQELQIWRASQERSGR